MTQNRDNISTITPEDVIPNYGQPDCQCQHCQNNRANGNRYIINHGSYKQANELAQNELNQQALPCDPDYVEVCSGVMAG